MKKLSAVILIALGMMLSGCTVAQLLFVRNLSEGTAEITFTFASNSGVILPDSIYIPYSSTVHLVNKKTIDHMKDSVLFRKFTLTKMRGYLPTGSMIMIDKNTTRKVQYHEPEKMEVVVSGKPVQEVAFGAATGDAKTFKVKGRMPVLRWYDIY